jgi:hypothetical protein
VVSVPGNYQVSFAAVPGYDYAVQTSTNLADPGAWQAFASVTGSNFVTTATATNTNLAAQKFYRLKRSLAPKAHSSLGRFGLRWQSVAATPLSYAQHQFEPTAASVRLKAHTNPASSNSPTRRPRTALSVSSASGQIERGTGARQALHG